MPHSVHSPGGVKTPVEGGGNAVDLSSRYWNANQPRSRWREECPEFLVGISEKNKVILSKRDEDFDRITWDKCKELVSTYTLHHVVIKSLRERDEAARHGQQEKAMRQWLTR